MIIRKLLMVLLILCSLMLSGCKTDVGEIPEVDYINPIKVVERGSREGAIMTAVFRDYIAIVKILEISDPIEHNPEDTSANNTDIPFTNIVVEITNMLNGEIDLSTINISLVGGYTPWGDFVTPHGIQDGPVVGDTYIIFFGDYIKNSNSIDRRYALDFYICYTNELEFQKLNEYDDKKEMKDQIKDIKDIIDDLSEIIEESKEKTIEDYFSD